MLLLCPVADVLLWRRRNLAVLTAAGATTVWFLFDRAGYSFLSVIANALLLLVVILFFWAKSALLLNRFAVPSPLLCSPPLPPLPNLEIPDEVVAKAADGARVWINRALAVGHDIAIRRDRKVFLQVLLLHFFASSRVGLDFLPSLRERTAGYFATDRRPLELPPLLYAASAAVARSFFRCCGCLKLNPLSLLPSAASFVTAVFSFATFHCW
ncbi:hypothetical protein BHM03_00020768 [Ensete ventricosum]|nr:hypothetical protein BHM03_00020768 [Ensete ventricosum]